MRHTIVGTIGHIDHGKTSLISAMNGFDGDENIEEKRRGITIDISFSSMSRGEKRVAFIDSPGHEKLVKNMIAGAFGFDFVLLVVASDDGVMPQTLEHLNIVDRLGIKEAVVAITKADKVTPDQLINKEKEIRELFDTLKNIKIHKILPTSIHDPKSIEELKNTLFELPQSSKNQDELFRLYIDRSFNIKGAGTVVTGTILGGAVKLKEKLFIYDTQKEVQIRGIEVHDKSVEMATAGERVALNLSGVEASSLKRGYLISLKGFLRGFNKIDAFLEALPDQKLLHNQKAQLFYGANSIETTMNLLDSIGSDQAFVELKTDKPIYAIYGEKIILRSDNKTIATGEILGPIGDPMKKSQKQEFLKALHSGDKVSAFATLVDAHKQGFGLVSSTQRFGLSHEKALDIACKLDGCFVDKSSLVVYPLSSKEELQEQIRAIYKRNRRAMLSSTSLNIRFKWASRSFIEFALVELLDQGVLKLENGLYKDINCDIKDEKAYIEDEIFARIDKAGLAPDAPYNIYDELDLDRKEGDDALKSLTTQAKVIRLAHNLFVTSTNLQNATNSLREIIKKEGYADVQNSKEILNLSRKYVICYLEYLDNFGDIKRIENRRVFV